MIYYVSQVHWSAGCWLIWSGLGEGSAASTSHPSQGPAGKPGHIILMAEAGFKSKWKHTRALESWAWDWHTLTPASFHGPKQVLWPSQEAEKRTLPTVYYGKGLEPRSQSCTHRLIKIQRTLFQMLEIWMIWKAGPELCFFSIIITLWPKRQPTIVLYQEFMRATSEVHMEDPGHTTSQSSLDAFQPPESCFVLNSAPRVASTLVSVVREPRSCWCLVEYFTWLNKEVSAS